MTKPLQISVNHAGTIMVIGGETYEEFATNIAAVLGSEAVGDILDQYATGFSTGPAVAAVIAQMPGVVPAAAPVYPSDGLPRQAVPATVAPIQPQTASESDQWGNTWTYGVPGAPSCPHGQRIQKTGTTKDGRSYSGWYCPTHSPAGYRNKTTKDANCKPEYIR